MSDIIASNHFGGRFGFAEAVINPPLDIYFRNWGAAKSDQATGFHKDLKMSCLVIQGTQSVQGASAAALYLLSADLGWWINPEDEKTLRRGVLENCGLSSSQLVICLTHTHSGPSICSMDKDKRGGQYIVAYLDFLKRQAIKLIRQASKTLVTGILEWTDGKCGLATNRDYLPDNKSDNSFNANKYLVGYNPKTEADDTILIGSVYSAGNGLLCTLVNYGCHPTTLAHENRLISPDFVGEMRETIQLHTGAPCMFLQGASGDLAPRVQYVASTAVPDAHGRQLAYAVLSALEGKPKVGCDYRFIGSLDSGAPLAVWENIPARPKMDIQSLILKLELPLQADDSIQQIEQQWQEAKKGKDRALEERLWRRLNKRRFTGEGERMLAQVWIWKLGDAFIVAQPNEAYSAFQVHLRKALPGIKVVVINIANGYMGYMLPADDYDKNMYSVNITPYGKGALEIMTEKVIEVIQKF